MTITLSEEQVKDIIRESVFSLLTGNAMFRYDALTEQVISREQCHLYEDAEGIDQDRVRKYALKASNYDINDYDGFLQSLSKTPKHLAGFISDHPKKELSQGQWKTFKLKGYDCGFALHFLGNGRVDICNLHNNSGIRGLGNYLLRFAKIQGGTQMDNYGTTRNGKNFLGDKYGREGFDVYDRLKWDDYFAPEGWDYEQFGRPDVEFRRRQKHTNKFNQKGEYRNSFNRYMKKQFPDIDAEHFIEKDS
jgi:hypothetical protein